MPIFSRSFRMSVVGELTSSPSTQISPPSIVSSPFMHRSKVLLPDPLLPMRATISPSAISIETSRSTTVDPNDLRAFLILTSDMNFRLKSPTGYGERVAKREVKSADEEEDEEWPERCGIHNLRSASELNK